VHVINSRIIIIIIFIIMSSGWQKLHTLSAINIQFSIGNTI